MRRNFFVSLFSFILFVVVTSTASANEFQATFDSAESAYAALDSGKYNPYEPKNFGLKGTTPVNGKDRQVVVLEDTKVARLLTPMGYKYVVLSKGTAVRCNMQADGTGVMYALDGCGNPGELVDRPVDPTPEPKATTFVTPLQPPAPVVNYNSYYYDGYGQRDRSYGYDNYGYRDRYYYGPDPYWGLGFSVGFGWGWGGYSGCGCCGNDGDDINITIVNRWGPKKHHRKHHDNPDPGGGPDPADPAPGGGPDPADPVPGGGPDRPEVAKVTPPKVTPPKVTPPKVTPPKVAPPKVTPPKVTPPKVTPPKVAPPKSRPRVKASARTQQSVRQGSTPRQGAKASARNAGKGYKTAGRRSGSKHSAPKGGNRSRR